MKEGVTKNCRMRTVILTSDSTMLEATAIVTITLVASVWASQVVLVVKNLPANTGDLRDTGSIPGSGRSPGGGYGNPLQYSCLENPHGQRSLVGYRATVMGSQRVGHT